MDLAWKEKNVATINIDIGETQIFQILHSGNEIYITNKCTFKKSY